jgi:hypothetical protein
MKTKPAMTMIRNLKAFSMPILFCVLGFSVLAYLTDTSCLAVTSKITRHGTNVDLLSGEAEDIVISSRGTFQLGRAWETVVEELEDIWSINCIFVSGGTVFFGTSPNGGIYKYSLGEITRIYPHETVSGESSEREEPNDANETGDANVVEVERYLSNEHIFVMATDLAGRLLAGISGDQCKLLRFEADKVETVFEPNDAKYIFAIAVDKKGDIYLGTGPEGKVYRFDPFDPTSSGVVYDSLDKNILSLAIGEDGFVYAGGDTRGLVYRINPRAQTATVLYDSDQPEITALLLSEKGGVYAAATSAKIVQAQTQFASQLPAAGRPEPPGPGKGASEGEGGRKLQIAHTGPGGNNDSSRRKPPPRKLPKPGEASFIYKITQDGYVTHIFSEAVILFCLGTQKGELLLGTGNSGQLFTIDPISEREAIIYEDEQASQITAIAVSGDDMYLGTANPAKLVKLGKAFALKGTYRSDLIDAGQPAKWGKLQIDADIPEGCRVLVASRSGNVEDVNDPTFSDWTEAEEMSGPVQLRCPLGRFCQYKLLLQSDNGRKSPLVREVAVASTVPNLAPKVESVSVSRVAGGGKTGVFKVSYQAKDDNEDKLVYQIDFRKIGRANWIKLEDQVEADSYEWNGKTVEDGRYEIRVTANDERSNTTTTKLMGSRISEPVVVDNTGPVIEGHSISKDGMTVTLKLRVSDELSAIGEAYYTVDSNAEWVGAMPDDLVYDTMGESFTVVIEDMGAGEHVVAVRVADAVGNATYKTFEVVTASD